MFETVKKIDDVKKFDSHIRMGITKIHKSIKRRWGQCYFLNWNNGKFNLTFFALKMQFLLY